jgi:hypothetical protein
VAAILGRPIGRERSIVNVRVHGRQGSYLEHISTHETSFVRDRLVLPLSPFRSFVGPWDAVFECHDESRSQSIDFIERLTDSNGSEISSVEILPVLESTKVSDCTVALAGR